MRPASRWNAPRYRVNGIVENIGLFLGSVILALGFEGAPHAPNRTGHDLNPGDREMLEHLRREGGI